MKDIEAIKPGAEMMETMETSQAKADEGPIHVGADIQTRIRRKVDSDSSPLKL